MFNKQCLVDCCEIGILLGCPRQQPRDPWTEIFSCDFSGWISLLVLANGVFFGFSDKLSLPGLGTATCTDPGTTASSSTSSTHSTATTIRTKLFVLWCLYTNQYNKYKQRCWWFHTFFYFHPYDLDDDPIHFRAWWVEAVSYTFWNGAIWVDVATWLMADKRQMRVEHHIHGFV